MYSSKINFYIPGAFTIPMELLSYLNEAYKNHKEMLRDNINIGCIYGSPGVIWNGGHYINGLLSTYELEDFKRTLEEWDIPLRFTFSNSLIEEKHLHDFFSNQLVEMFATGKNEIICNSPLLEDYLRNKYGDTYKYISSTTKCLENISEQVDEIDKDYFLTVLDVDNNKNFEFLKGIKDKSKVEILVNSTCRDNCPNKAKHYKLISKVQLNNGMLPETEEEKAMFNCPWSLSILYKTMKHNHFITPEEIENVYLPMGFTNFKLEGRCTSNSNWAEIISYYLFKPEYQMEVRQDLASI